MTTSSKRKGDKAELEIARILADLTGFPVRRKLGAGRTDDEGDLDGLPSCVGEVKSYTSFTRGMREALDDLERERVNAGVPFAAGFVRRHGGGWCVVMDVPHFCTLLREATS